MFKLLLQPTYKLRLPSSDAFADQTVLITGASGGLGLETARHVLNLGAKKVIMGVRSVRKGVTARTQILSSLADPETKEIEIWEVDLCSFASVRAFATRAECYVSSSGEGDGEKRIDVAIMNAGVASVAWATTEDGWETQIQVNGLSTALLSLRLLPVLLRGGEVPGRRRRPHLVIVASDIHQTAKFQERSAPNILAALNDPLEWAKSQKAAPTERYAVTKLMSIWTTMEVADLVPKDGDGLPRVIVTSCTPGFSHSDLLAREAKVPMALKVMQTLTARSSENGAKAVVHAAVSNVQAHGKWSENQVITTPGRIVTSPDGEKLGNKAWKEILDVLEKDGS